MRNSLKMGNLLLRLWLKLVSSLFKRRQFFAPLFCKLMLGSYANQSRSLHRQLLNRKNFIELRIFCEDVATPETDGLLREVFILRRHRDGQEEEGSSEDLWRTENLDWDFVNSEILEVRRALGWKSSQMKSMLRRGGGPGPAEYLDQGRKDQGRTEEGHASRATLEKQVSHVEPSIGEVARIFLHLACPRHKHMCSS